MFLKLLVFHLRIPLTPIKSHDIPYCPIKIRVRVIAVLRAPGTREFCLAAWGFGVALFLSTFLNKVDKKGRVSVPASFRSALVGQTFDGLIVTRSFVQPAIDGMTIGHMETLATSIDQLNPYGADYDTFANTIIADSQQLGVGEDGRIVLPEQLREHANIKDQAAFVGRGSTFQIWEPDAFQAVQEEARARALENRDALSLKPPGSRPADGDGGR